jgi:hypothetical protein
MGRPPGSPNKPGSKKPGPKPGRAKYQEDKTPDDEKLRIKYQIVEMLDSRVVDNLSQAADMLGISRLRLYQWKRRDSEWADLLNLADELIADDLEQRIANVKTVPECTSLIFRLKALRPDKYRDNYKFDVRDSRVLEHLAELKKLGKQARVQEVAEPDSVPETEKIAEQPLGLPLNLIGAKK